jgi:acyl dehydratase
MLEQVYYEDVVMGSEIAALVKRPTPHQLVLWAEVARDYNPLHCDRDFAQRRGLPGTIVPGQLAGCFLGQMITDWAGVGGRLRKLTCSYKEMNFPDQTITCKASVSEKYVEAGEECVECNVWIENAKGEKTVLGKAVVVLPSRG